MKMIIDFPEAPGQLWHVKLMEDIHSLEEFKSTYRPPTYSVMCDTIGQIKDVVGEMLPDCVDHPEFYQGA